MKGTLSLNIYKGVKETEETGGKVQTMKGTLSLNIYKGVKDRQKRPVAKYRQ